MISAKNHNHAYLSRIFTVEIPTRNGLSSFCKYHLEQRLRKKSKKVMWNFRFWGRIRDCLWHCLFLCWWCSGQNRWCRWRSREPVHRNAQVRKITQKCSRSERSRKNLQRIHGEWDSGIPEDSIAWCRRPGPCRRTGGSLEKRVQQHR